MPGPGTGPRPAVEKHCSNQILSVGVGLNSMCYSILLYMTKSSLEMDLNFEPKKN